MQGSRGSLQRGSEGLGGSCDAGYARPARGGAEEHDGWGRGESGCELPDESGGVDCEDGSEVVWV